MHTEFHPLGVVRIYVTDRKVLIKIKPRCKLVEEITRSESHVLNGPSFIDFYTLGWEDEYQKEISSQPNHLSIYKSGKPYHSPSGLLSISTNQPTPPSFPRQLGSHFTLLRYCLHWSVANVGRSLSARLPLLRLLVSISLKPLLPSHIQFYDWSQVSMIICAYIMGRLITLVIKVE